MLSLPIHYSWMFSTYMKMLTKVKKWAPLSIDTILSKK